MNAEMRELRKKIGEIPDMDSVPEGPGRLVRGIRKDLGLTLAEASTRTGISVSTLSKLETGKMSLSYEKLIRLRDGLGFDARQVLTAHRPEDTPRPDVVPSGRRSITRRGDGPEMESNNYRYQFPASELIDPAMKPMFIDVNIRSIDDFGELIRHPGEEFVLVLEGECVFHSELYKPTHLNTGDSMYFDASAGHAYIAAGEERCRLLCVCSAADSELAPIVTRIARSIIPDRAVME